MAKISVIGTGTWGIALARMLFLSGHEVICWSALPDEIDELESSRIQKNLPNMIIPFGIEFTKDIALACAGRDILLFAVPSVYVRSTARTAAPFVAKDQIIVNVAKGIEPETLCTMSEIIEQEIPDVPVVALSGPTHAEEVAKDLPTTIVSACEDAAIAERVQKEFSNPVMRVYTNTDVKGVELCGALKNIIAIASGISAGLGYGDNTEAALITRGLAEIERLGTKMGCLNSTFSGLAGMGDLIVTATSRHSRNNRCGFLIGQGYSPEDAVKQVGMVVEGINAIPAAMKLSKDNGVEMPIVFAVNDIINNGCDPKSVVRDLMGREMTTELPMPILDPDHESETAACAGSADIGASRRRVITYGTFDLIHYGHINLLRRAKALGDYLIVALSTDEFNWSSKKKRCYFTYEQRKLLLEALRCVDLVIPEESWEQKLTDVKEYGVSVFAVGNNWKGKFDYLENEGVDVVYLPMTPEL